MSDTILRLLILIVVFAAVLLAVESGVGSMVRSRRGGKALNERLRLIASGVDRGEVVSRLRRDDPSGTTLPGPIGALSRHLNAMLGGAGLRIPTERLLAYMVLATALMFLFGWMFAWWGGVTLNVGKLLLLATFALAAGFGLPMMFFSRLADRRRKKLVAQFPVALDVFVRGLRAGHPVSSALEILTEEMPDPIGSEFGIAVDETTYGADLRDALQSMADRCGVDDMQMFVVSLSVQSETGGNLAEILENLSQVIRDRASMMLKVRALSSEGRMTALLLTALPIMAFVGLFLLSPAFYLDVADDPAFVPGFIGLIILYFIGFFTIRKMVDLKV